MAVTKIHCIFHEDATPSMALYHDGGYCFGCQRSATLQQLGESNRVIRRKSLPKEDVLESLIRIRKLPVKEERGFTLPYDARGYYIVYPNKEYYIHRLYGADNASKYRGPGGHVKPLFLANKGNTSLLFIVEGQLNALTLATVTKYTVVSPGGAGDLCKPEFINHYLRYNTICIIVDKDVAGVAAAIKLKNVLGITLNRKVLILAMETDLNELYVNEGKESIKKQETECLRLLGMRGREELPASTAGVEQGNGA